MSSVKKFYYKNKDNKLFNSIFEKWYNRGHWGNVDKEKMREQQFDWYKKLKQIIEDIKKSDLDIVTQNKLIKRVEGEIDLIESFSKLDTKSVQKEFWKDLIKAFKKLAWDEKRVIKTKSWDKFTKVETLKTTNANAAKTILATFII